MKDVKYNILINKTTDQFSQRGFECILGVVLAIGVLSLLMFVPIAGIALAIFASSFLCIGVKKYLVSIAKNNFMPVEDIFSSYKICIKAFCLKFATMLISALWAIIFIIPGIVSLLNYSMASFVLAENPETSSLECMVKSKKLVNGFKGQICIIYLAYFFVVVVAACVIASLAIVIRNFTAIPIWITIIGAILAFIFVLLVFIIPYFELMLANIYVILSKNQEKQKTSAFATKSSAARATPSNARKSATASK